MNLPVAHIVDPPLVGIVDDDESIREALSSLLRSVGYKTLNFSSARQFLDFAQRGSVNCLILDRNLPGRSGLELQARLTHARAPIPIIFISSEARPEFRIRALELGALGYFKKPFSDEALLDRVRLAIKTNGCQTKE